MKKEKKTNKHKEFWRDTPWCVSRLSRKCPICHVISPVCPADIPPLELEFPHKSAQTSRVSLGRPEFIPGALPGHSDRQIPLCDFSLPDPCSVDFCRETLEFRFEFCRGFFGGFFPSIFFQGERPEKIHRKSPAKFTRDFVRINSPRISRSCFIGKRGTFQNASEMRQKCAEHLWGRTPFGRYRFFSPNLTSGGYQDDGKGELGLRGVAFMTVLTVLAVLKSTLPSFCLSYKVQCQETTVTVLTVLAVVTVPVVTATYF